MNVTIYGDSILKGVVLENGKYAVNRDWEDRLSRLLGVTIRNRSRFGCTIGKALPFIEKDAQTEAVPGEVAILEFGGNDCDYNWAEISENPAGSFDCKTPPKQFTALYKKALALLRASGRTPMIATLPPIHSERYLQFICRDGLSQNNILQWLGDVEHISRWQAEYSEMVKKIAADEGTDLIDLRSAFPKEGNALAELLCADGIHPSRDGQALIYEAFRKKAG
ncbi:MAG: SGNH/GDSL hydrolase family protein [Oscillospiraceae bacterium]|nr:SGNH/GDSL hydrolase family protein [Oscillospiraceae bacterium]